MIEILVLAYKFVTTSLDKHIAKEILAYKFVIASLNKYIAKEKIETS